jgi:hypothetical protein
VAITFFPGLLAWFFKNLHSRENGSKLFLVAPAELKVKLSPLISSLARLIWSALIRNSHGCPPLVWDPVLRTLTVRPESPYRPTLKMKELALS